MKIDSEWSFSEWIQSGNDGPIIEIPSPHWYEKGEKVELEDGPAVEFSE